MFEQIEPYKKHLASVRQWTDFIKEHPELNLPTVSSIIYHYGSWNEAKSRFGYVIPVTIRRIKSFTEEQLIDILKPHKKHLSTVVAWDEYVSSHQDLQLPNSPALIEYFSTWNNMKKTMDLPVLPANRPTLYTKDDIIKIVREYAPHSFSPRKWEKFRKEQNKTLPSYQTITKNLSKEEREKLWLEYEQNRPT